MSLTLADQTLARPDLADLLLEGQVRAARFAPVRAMRSSEAAADILAAPEAGAPRLDQLLHGEVFRVLETREGWAWGQAARDGQTGFIRIEHLTEASALPTHRVAAAWAEVAGRRLPLNALVRAEGGEGLADLHSFDADAAVAARRLIGAPQAEGGRTPDGLDAWGLVRQALFAAGKGAPSLSGAGLIEIGRALSGDERPISGDVVIDRHGPAVVADAETVIRVRPGSAVGTEPLGGYDLAFRP